jgi:hypothetical protein
MAVYKMHNNVVGLMALYWLKTGELSNMCLIISDILNCVVYLL